MYPFSVPLLSAALILSSQDRYQESCWILEGLSFSGGLAGWLLLGLLMLLLLGETHFLFHEYHRSSSKRP